MRIRWLCICAAVLSAAVFSFGCDTSSPGSADDGHKTGNTPSSACSITSFAFKATDNPVLAGDLSCAISGGSISANAGLFCPLQSLVPTIAVSAGASVLPTSGAAADFRGLVIYTVTAEDGSIDVYTVTLSNGTVTLIAGGPAYVSGYADGTGTGATFFAPDAISCDGINLYIADTQNSTIRKMVIATGVVATLAGFHGSENYSALQTTGASARFKRPSGIAIYNSTLYIADTLNNNIRQLDLTPPNYNVSATGIQGNYLNPRGIAVAGTNLYIADTSNNRILKEIIGDSQVSTFAGQTNKAPGYYDGTGTLHSSAAPSALPRTARTCMSRIRSTTRFGKW